MVTLDIANFLAIKKFDRKGSLDTLLDVAKQVQRIKEAWTGSVDQMPVFGPMAARFNDDGVTALYPALNVRLAELGLTLTPYLLSVVLVRYSADRRQSCL